MTSAITKRRKLRKYLEKNNVCFVSMQHNDEKHQTTAFYKRLRGDALNEAVSEIMEICDAND